MTDSTILNELTRAGETFRDAHGERYRLAAAEIIKLRSYNAGLDKIQVQMEAKIARLLAALKPFAEVAAAFAGAWSSKYDDCPLAIEHCDADDRDITIADLKRLHAAIEQTPQGGDHGKR